MVERSQTDAADNEAMVKEGDLVPPDLDSLISLARSSEDHEAYHVVVSRRHFRVGLVVDTSLDAPISFRVEVLLQVLAKDTQPKVADLARMNKILESLSNRGYSLGHHESCWVTCEREVAVDDIGKECLEAVTIVQGKEGVKR